MSTLTTYVKGGTIEEVITVTDEDGTPIDIATLTDLWLRIYQKSIRYTITERSLLGGTIITVNASAGQIKPLITEIETASMHIGIWAYELEAKIFDAEWISNFRYIKTNGDYFVLVETIE